MEPFKLDRQAKAFLAVLIIIALALVPLAPFASLAFGGLSLVVLCIVFLMALARNRRAFGPLTPAEGALAVSAAVFAIGGALVIVYATLMLGAGNAMMLSHAMLPFSAPDAPRRPGTSGTWYSDPIMRQQLKAELAKAGIPFTVSEQDGKEFVNWSQEHSAAVEAIREKMHSGPAGGSMHFASPATRQEFAEWLGRKAIKTEIVTKRGKEYLVWHEATAETRELLEEFYVERAKRCKEKTAQAPSSAKCS